MISIRTSITSLLDEIKKGDIIFDICRASSHNTEFVYYKTERADDNKLTVSFDNFIRIKVSQDPECCTRDKYELFKVDIPTNTPKRKSIDVCLNAETVGIYNFSKNRLYIVDIEDYKLILLKYRENRKTELWSSMVNMPTPSNKYIIARNLQEVVSLERYFKTLYTNKELKIDLIS